MEAKPRRPVFVLSLFVMLSFVVTGIFLLGQLDSVAQDGIERQSEMCLDCHEEQQTSLFGSDHQILTEKDVEEARVACTDCHPGTEKHWDEDPEEYPMANPSKTDLSMTAQICATCHVNSHQQNMLERNIHAENDIKCTDCHQIHGAEHEGQLRAEEYDLCLGCHTNVRGQFTKPNRHPVDDHIIKCSDCHLTLDTTAERVSFAGTNEPCFACHTQFRPPFPYEHQATVDFYTQEGACLTCHEPHGSYLPRMLKQPYEPPNFQLCSQCHIVPKHKFNNFHGPQWADVACNECHVDIHGSYESRLFFDPALKSRGCFNTGCHQF